MNRLGLRWKLRNRRAPPDIVAQILQKSHGGATRTRIMNAVGLSYKALKEYVFLMTGRPKLSAASKSYQQSIKVLEILQQNKGGLTSREIRILLGERVSDSLLYRLQKAGKVKQKKAILANGIGYVYVLNTRN